MQFASDNTAKIAPAILAAIVAANDGFAPGYGEDAMTTRVTTTIEELFAHEAACFLVPTGTAANALAIAHMAPPWGAVLCHEEAHIMTDECGAPEFFGHGLKLVGLAGEGCKIAAPTLQAALSRGAWGGPHHVIPSVLSLTQPTEAGTIYQEDEIRRLAAIAHDHGLKVHVDGARFGNALVRLGRTPAEMTWSVGVDALSLGATKGGALAAEAVILFDKASAAGMSERRKRAGHLVSKHRFIAAQFEAFLTGGLWLDLARQANRMADRLSGVLLEAGLPPVFPVEANEIFVRLPQPLDVRLRSAGASYHPWSTRSLPPNVTIGAEESLVRLVTSFATTESAIERFAAILDKS